MLRGPTAAVRFLGRNHRQIGALGIVSVIAIVVLSNVVVWLSARGAVVDDRAELSGTYDAVIVPGARVWDSGRPSQPLRQRIDAAVELYESSVVDHILASGDNGSAIYDEPTIIRRRAHQQGVPLTDITLDYAGFSTWDTCVRANEIFGVERAVFVTQARFADRAAALCGAAGIDVDVLALGDWRLSAREIVAAVKASYEIIVRPDPRFLGDVVGLVGSENPANPDPELGESRRPHRSGSCGPFL